MISDKSFSPEEFQAKIKEFAQEFINRVSVIQPGTTLNLVQESETQFIMNVTKPAGVESYRLYLDAQGKVNTISVYG